MPLRTGATWTIDKIDLVNNVSETRVQVVGSAEEMDGDKEGVIAHPVTTSKDTGTVVVWQEDTGSAVVRHAQEDRAGQTFRDDVYSPSKGRLDERAEHLMEGATWTESYTARSTDLSDEQTTTEEREEEWRVERYGEEVEVPAGTFCTIRVSRTRTTDGVRGAEKLYWFARGVGKVKERNATVREVLTDYSVPAP